MQLFHLRPIRTDAPHWWASRYSGPCFVSAEDEAAARSAVARCFAQGGPWSPWERVDLAACTPVRALDRIPPDPDVIMIPSRAAFGGWRALPVPAASPQRLRRRA
jgi:hypothetical protein